MIQIICTKNLTTGGAELLHQMCYELTNIDIKSTMVYYHRQQDSFSATNINCHYKKYCKDEYSSDLADFEDNVIIFPEVMAYLAKKIKKARVVIWWLSVDNYLINFNIQNIRSNGIKSTLLELKKVTRRPKISSLSKYMHICQSYYAIEFLESQKINSILVSDYINTEFQGKDNKSLSTKEDIICYNPKKGIEVSKKIIKYFKLHNSPIQFIPIIDLTPTEVKALFEKSKIYIDFGNHPGKDRMPREARLQNCVIITGTKGAAANDFDIAISPIYKFNENKNNFLSDLYLFITEVTSNYNHHNCNQSDYLMKIKAEKMEFRKQIEKLCSLLLLR